MKKKINVFILTGFLGAGKTTMLNQLLLQFENEQNVVIENEFGKVNIDAQLVKAKYETVYEMTNGCICCSLDDELYDLLSVIAPKRFEIDNLFIETTGIADVGNIITIFKVKQVSSFFKLKKVICVADCQNLEDSIDEAIETQRQLVASDLIVLNKTTTVNATYVNYLSDLVASINPYATIFKSTTGFLDRKLLSQKHNSKRLAIDVSKYKENTHKINTVLYESEDIFDYQNLYYTLNTTLLLYYHQVYRIKGFIKCINSSNYLAEAKVYEVQSTGKTLTIVPIQKSEFKKNQLVFIGRQLKTDVMARILKSATHNASCEI